MTLRPFLSALPLLAALSACVAPEEPPPPRPARAAAVPAAPASAAGFEPAPVANRGMKAPSGPPVLQVEGMGGKK